MLPKAQDEAERLEELLERYIEQLTALGTTPDPRQLCRDSPELLAPLLEHIAEYRRLEALLAPARGPAVGEMVGHYRIVGLLGEGGMGRVYLAEDTKLGRRVALKALAPEMAGDPAHLRRFRREARLLAALSHPNIVTVFSVEEDEGFSFLAMERVEGKTLEALIPAGGMTDREALPIAEQLVDALVAAHRQGVIHRDLKPGNVMVDPAGRVKVLDFGLAKSADGSGGGPGASTLTAAGHLLGTLPYMPPEQLQGLSVDRRSDLFSLGVMLYQLVSGRRPFEGASIAELVSAILRDRPAALMGENGGSVLEGVITRCLQKDPADRFQSADELGHALRGVLGAPVGTTAPAGARRWSGPRNGLLAIGLGVVVLLGGLYWSRGPGDPSRSSPVSSTSSSASFSATSPDEPLADGRARAERTSLAVLFFRNATAEPELDWLRRGITDMLVTDLSQSAELRVLSTGRLVHALQSLELLGEPSLPFDALAGIAEQTGVGVVARGSYARVDEILRIDVTLESTTDGTILDSRRVEGRVEDDLFVMLDTLATAIRDSFAVPPPARGHASVTAVTTSSLEAWRLYSEANELHSRSKRREAVALLEEAVAIDPTFALALADLGRLHRDLGHATRARELLERAVEQAERLPLDQRPEITAVHYATRWRTMGRAIEAFEEALRLHPERGYLHNNLAKVYADLERYDEAIAEYRARIDSGSEFAGSYADIANAHAALGQFETGYRILSQLADRRPEDWWTRLHLGWLSTEWGRLDQALEWLARAEALRPGDLFIHYGRWRVQVLRQNWARADFEADRMLAVDDELAQWRGAVSRARNLTYRGRSQEALRALDRASRAYGEPGAMSALAHCWQARLLLERGDPLLALEQAARCRALGRDEWPELEAIFLTALSHQRLDRPLEVERSVAELGRRVLENPNAIEQRQLHHLEGLLALARGETALALEELKRAEALLPPQGVEFHYHLYPQHVPIWYALGRAELAAGAPERAIAWFRGAVTSGAEHLESPVPYVRSFYQLGRLHRQRGELERARQELESFLELWGEGDLDPEQVAEARAILAGAR